MNNRAKSSKRSRGDKRSRTDGNEGRESNTKAYDTLSIYSDITEPVVVIDGLKTKCVMVCLHTKYHSDSFC